jgi:hypothetical protein
MNFKVIAPATDYLISVILYGNLISQLLYSAQRRLAILPVSVSLADIHIRRPAVSLGIDIPGPSRKIDLRSSINST